MTDWRADQPDEMVFEAQPDGTLLLLAAEEDGRLAEAHIRPSGTGLYGICSGWAWGDWKFPHEATHDYPCQLEYLIGLGDGLAYEDPSGTPSTAYVDGYTTAGILRPAARLASPRPWGPSPEPQPAAAPCKVLAV